MKIYLACPYTHQDKHIEAQRFWKANEKAAELLNQGHIIFSPISHSHPIHLAGQLPGDYAFWKAQAEAFVPWCDEMWIYCLPGWEESKGIKEETDLASAIGKPIKRIS